MSQAETSTRRISRGAARVAERVSTDPNKPQRRHKRDGSGAKTSIFDIPKKLIPRGYTVEWKMVSVLGKEADPSYGVELEEQGWVPATIEQFPDLMPKNYQGKSIIRKGMMLMIRPKELTEEARQEDLSEAREQVKDKLIQLGKADKGEFKRKIQKLGRSYERPPVEDDGIETGEDE